MAGFGASSFHDQVQSVRNQIRNALEEDDDAASEWFDGTLSETAASSQAGSRQQCILGQHVMPQVGDHVVVLDPQLARWLVEPTGTILEERYYNTGKDGVYQLALAPPMPSLVADPRPRFSLPRPPSKVEVKAASNVSQAASNTIQQRPRYSEVRRSGSQSRQPTVAAAAEPQVETAARSTSVSSSRPRYSELRKARRSAAMGEAPETCASSTSAGEALRQPTDSLQQEHLQPPTAVDEMPGLESKSSTPRTRSRYSELRKASRSPVRLSETRSPTAPSETSVPKPVQPDPPPTLPGDRGPEIPKMEELFKRLDMMERETTLLTKQLKELKASKQSDIQLIREECRQEVEACERRCMSSCMDQSRRHLEVCEERLRQHFEAETRQLLEMAERQILGEVKERSLKMLRSCGSPDRSSGPQPSETNEEPEQEYETPNGEEEPYYLDKAVGREVTQVGLSRAELADSELSLQTIGSIARRVSASLGGRPSGAPATQRDNPGDSRRQPAQVQRPKEQKERGFDLEQEMEHLADMRRFASQVLGSRGSEAASSRLTRDASQAEWRDQAEFADRSPRRATTPPPASPMFGHPVPALLRCGSPPCRARPRRCPVNAGGDAPLQADQKLNHPAPGTRSQTRLHAETPGMQGPTLPMSGSTLIARGA